MNLLRIFLLLLLESVFCLLSRLCRSPSKVASIGVYTSEYETRFKNLGNLYNGSDSLSRLASSHVCVIGLGGVGSWAVEALARSGVGEFTLVDADDVCTSNTNRQIQALTSTVGKMKATSLSDRILDINPEAKVTCIFDFIRKENIHKFVNSSKAFSVIVDATDSVSDKAAIINACVEYGLPVVTTGGVGGLIDPLSFEVSDLTDTRGDNLLMQVRKKLRQKYGYPSPGPKGGGPQTAKQRKIKPWNIPCVHTIPIGRSRGQPAAACGNEVSIETSSTKRLGSSFRKCDALFGNAVSIF